MKKSFPFLLILGVLVLSVGGGALLYRSQANDKPVRPVPTVHIGANPAHLRGEASAPVLLEEFGDFQCPVCGQFYKILKQVESEYGSQLKVVFREYPIQQLHPHALEAAHAAEAAGQQNKFWEMHDMLYDNQDTWTKEQDVRPTFDAYAKSLGLNVNQFDYDMSSSAVAGRCIDDQVRARDFGVTGTPTIFVDGKPPKDRSIDSIRNAINDALREKGQ